MKPSMLLTSENEGRKKTHTKKDYLQLLTKGIKVSHGSTSQTPGNKHQSGTGPTVYVTAAHSACTTALNVPALQRFTHSSSTLNESANHPMHWTSQTILYLSSGYRRENNDSLTQVKKAMRLNQYFYYGPLRLNPWFQSARGHFLCSLLVTVIEDCYWHVKLKVALSCNLVFRNHFRAQIMIIILSYCWKKAFHWDSGESLFLFQAF